jgi:hypothetical protein
MENLLASLWILLLCYFHLWKAFQYFVLPARWYVRITIGLQCINRKINVFFQF